MWYRVLVACYGEEDGTILEGGVAGFCLVAGACPRS